MDEETPRQKAQRALIIAQFSIILSCITLSGIAVLIIGKISS